MKKNKKKNIRVIKVEIDVFIGDFNDNSKEASTFSDVSIKIKNGIKEDSLVAATRKYADKLNDIAAESYGYEIESDTNYERRF